jgi:tetratricopeptide (TPR) repeat protein
MARGITSQATTDKPQGSEAEAAAAKAVETAADLNAKFVAAADFVKKYPKSSARKHLSEYLVDQIFDVKDPNEELAQAQKFATIFTEPSEVNTGRPVLIDAYINAKRYDDAFSTGAAHLAKNADDILILINLTITGTEQIKQQNTKFLDVSKQYGTTAIGLIEADKKPAGMDDAFWTKEKGMLPLLYQEIGFILFVQQQPTEARAKLEKATQLSPADPFNYVLLSNIANDEYRKEATAWKGMTDGKAKDDQLQKATALLDKVLDLDAHAVALSEGKDQYKALHDELRTELEAYYKFRHQNSTEGLQKLVDGYKLP